MTLTESQRQFLHEEDGRKISRALLGFEADCLLRQSDRASASADRFLIAGLVLGFAAALLNWLSVVERHTVFAAYGTSIAADLFASVQVGREILLWRRRQALLTRAVESLDESTAALDRLAKEQQP